jgi:hypothetical protein
MRCSVACLMAQSSSVWHHILSSRCESSSSRNVTAVVVGLPGSGKKVVMGSVLGQRAPSVTSATAGAPLVYAHSSLTSALGIEVNLEVFAVGGNTQLLSVVFANSSHRRASDLVVALCLDITLQDACVQQCQQLVDEVAQCWSATRADGADVKPAIVIFACRGDLLEVDDTRWELISSRLRLLALNCGAAFAVQSSSSFSTTSQQIVLAALQLASWPPPSLQRVSFFVPPSHDSAASLRAIIDMLGNDALSLSNSWNKSLDHALPKPTQAVAPGEDQVGVIMCRARACLQLCAKFLLPISVA